MQQDWAALYVHKPGHNKTLLTAFVEEVIPVTQDLSLQEGRPHDETTPDSCGVDENDKHLQHAQSAHEQYMGP